MTGGLYSVTQEIFPRCIDFLQARELRCISLMSHLVTGGKPTFPAGIGHDFVYISRNEKEPEIDGVLLCTHSGILLHCFREEIDEQFYAPKIRTFLSRLTLRCLIGEHHGTCFLESLIPVKPESAFDYQLMTLDTMPGDRQCSVQFRALLDTEAASIVRANPLDAEELYPLQEGYELEEVVPPGGAFSRDACLANLKTALEKQYIYALKTGNCFIAKAGTNALGLNWDQIGGVFTSPLWRGRGIASALVAFTARERMRENRKIALFVKLTNLFAQKSYKNAGFLPKNLFRLSYYTYN